MMQIWIRTIALILIPGILAGQTTVPAPQATPEGAGELKIYSLQTQIGTIASRTFRDSAGRIVKEIYYTGNFSRPPYAESDLKVQSIQLTRYDSRGLAIEREDRGPDNQTRQIIRTAFDLNGNISGRKTFRPDETLQYEERVVNGSIRSRLTFDDTGKRLVGIDGQLPSDLDLADGWGSDVMGLACGIALSKSSGDPSDVVVFVNFRSKVESMPFVERLPDPIVTVRDADGKEIALSPGQVQSPPWAIGKTVAPGQAIFFSVASMLKDGFSALPHGRYTLSFQFTVPTYSGTSLQSNTVTFFRQR